MNPDRRYRLAKTSSGENRPFARYQNMAASSDSARLARTSPWIDGTKSRQSAKLVLSATHDDCPLGTVTARMPVA